MPWRNCHFLSVFVIQVALILWVHDNIFISKLCLWSGRAYFKRAVLKSVKFAFLLLVYYFIVGNYRLAFRIPIGDSMSAIYQSIFVHFFECRSDGNSARLGKGKTLARPVKRGPDFS